MYGYILALALLGVVAFLGLAALVRSGPNPGGGPTNRPPGDRVQPSADEPTPGRSVVASPAEQEAAQRATPPA